MYKIKITVLDLNAFSTDPGVRLKGTWLVRALCLLGDARENDVLSAQLTEVDRPVPRVDRCRLKQCGKTEQQCKEDGTLTPPGWKMEGFLTSCRIIEGLEGLFLMKATPESV